MNGCEIKKKWNETKKQVEGDKTYWFNPNTFLSSEISPLYFYFHIIIRFYVLTSPIYQELSIRF